MKLFAVYGDTGDYYCGDELIGVGATQEEADAIAAVASVAGNWIPKVAPYVRWHDIRVEQIESGQLLNTSSPESKSQTPHQN